MTDSILNHKWEKLSEKIRVADNSGYQHIHIAKVCMLNHEWRQIASIVASIPEWLQALKDISEGKDLDQSVRIARNALELTKLTPQDQAYTNRDLKQITEFFNEEQFK